jgi:SAM-dependent methyltransferase
MPIPQLPLLQRLANQRSYRSAKKQFEQQMRQSFGSDYCPVDPGIAAPPDLVVQTSALDEQMLAQQVQPEVYFAGGYLTTAYWLKILEHHGFNVRTIGSIFELGCGTARLLRHFRGIDGIRLAGSDLNPAMIDWCQSQFPSIEFYRNGLAPELPFADNSFDFAYALSVFTHIPIADQQAWLQEIQRILRPGGVFLCTIVGNSHPHWDLLSELEKEQYRRQGHLTLTSDDARASLSTQVGGSAWDVFQTRSQVIQSFGSVMRLIDYIPCAQDILVLQKAVPSALSVAKPFPSLVRA